LVSYSTLILITVSIAGQSLLVAHPKFVWAQK